MSEMSNACIYSNSRIIHNGVEITQRGEYMSDDLTYEGMKNFFNRSEYNTVKFVCRACETVVFWDDFECSACTRMIEWCPISKNKEGEAFTLRI